MTHLAGNFLNAGVVSRRWGTAHPSIVPYQTLQTSDGYMTVGCGNDKYSSSLRLFVSYFVFADSLWSFARELEDQSWALARNSSTTRRESRTGVCWCLSWRRYS